MMVPFESAVRRSLEGSRGGRAHVPTTCRGTITRTALHHYQGRNSRRPMPALVDATPRARTPASTPGGHSPSIAPTPGARSNRGLDVLRRSSAARWPAETGRTGCGTRQPRPAGRHHRAHSQRQSVSSCDDSSAMHRWCRVVLKRDWVPVPSSQAMRPVERSGPSLRPAALSTIGGTG